MKKLSILLSVLVIMGLILSACSTGNEDDGIIMTPEMTLEETSQIPDTGGTDDMAGTPTGDTTQAESTVTLEVTEAMTQTLETPTATGSAGAQATGTPQAAATTLPNTGSGEIDRLTEMMNLQVVDRNGAAIGRASDYVLNMCEAHILYIVVDGDTSLGLQSGSRFLVPYEFVTLQDGEIRAETGEIMLNLDASELANVPVFTGSLDMEAVNWESDVIAFWSSHTALSLTTECRLTRGAENGDNILPFMTSTPAITETATVTATVTAEPTVQPTRAPGSDTVIVYKVGFASEILMADLRDGNGNLLGIVEDFIVVPETGFLRYVVVILMENNVNNPGAGNNANTNDNNNTNNNGNDNTQATPTPADNGNGNSGNSNGSSSGNNPNQGNAVGKRFVFIPLGGVNIFYEADGTPYLVLLADPQLFLGAPAFNAIPDTSRSNWDAEIFSYWSVHIDLVGKDRQP